MAGTVDQDLRLDIRHLDLRTPANQAIFRIQSSVCQHFRASLTKQGFQVLPWGWTYRLLHCPKRGMIQLQSADARAWLGLKCEC